jgi:drug/metabolite transporter (DMT)-like permease
MSPFSIGLILLSAVFHASWNILAKRSTDKPSFFWLAGVVASVCMLPVLWLYWQPITLMGWFIIGLSSLFEAFYLVCLGKAYQSGDLSLVYPLSRGSVPLFVLVLAFGWLGERVTALGIFGIALTVIGIYVLHLKSFAWVDLLGPFAALRTPVSRFALGAAICTAAYSTLDKHGVALVNPTFYTAWIFVGYSVFLGAFMWRQPNLVQQEWRQHGWRVIAVGVLSVITYMLVSYVLTSSPASYVSALRGVSIVFGSVFGVALLGEAMGRIKVIGSLILFTGMIGIALAK